LPTGNIRIYGVAYAGGRINQSEPEHLVVASDRRVRHLQPRAPSAPDDTAPVVKPGSWIPGDGAIRARRNPLVLGPRQRDTDDKDDPRTLGK
jgi:hypothetical protein